MEDSTQGAANGIVEEEGGDAAAQALKKKKKYSPEKVVNAKCRLCFKTETFKTTVNF